MVYVTNVELRPRLFFNVSIDDKITNFLSYFYLTSNRKKYLLLRLLTTKEET